METIQRVLARLRRRGSVTVQNTGPVEESDGGRAVSGYSGPAPRSGARVTVRNTGSATAHGPGSRSVSGIDYS